jgi:hypothetical protein
MKQIRKIYIPQAHLDLFLPWLDITDCGDSIELYMYNHASDGANLEVSGNKDEVSPFMDLLINYLRIEVCYETIDDLS